MNNYIKIVGCEDKLLRVLMMFENGLMFFIVIFNDSRILEFIVFLIRNV